MSRAVVIGGGLAGSVAALELASRGVATTVVARTPGATALTWGSLDVAGAAPPGSGGLPARHPLRGEWIAPEARLRVWCREHEHHPYARLFPRAGGEAAAPAAVKAAVAALDAWLAPAGLRVGGGLEATRWIPDVRGALRGADFAFTGAAEAALEEDGEIVLADVAGLAGFDARPAARLLAAEIDALGLGPRRVRVQPLVLPEALLGAAEAPARLAARLDREDGLAAFLDAAARLDVRGALLLLPPVLGMQHVARTLAALRERTGARVGELLGAPPLAMPGLRLAHALRAALVRAEVEVRIARAVAIEAASGRAVQVRLADGGPLDADAVVLATGRYVGGGIGEANGALAEALLGLPLYESGGARVDGVPAHRLAARDYDAPQPLYSAGVRTDAAARPLGASAAPALANLFAAGEILGGYDPARQRTGLGVALVTGRHAGASAAAALTGDAS